MTINFNDKNAVTDLVQLYFPATISQKVSLRKCHADSNAFYVSLNVNSGEENAVGKHESLLNLIGFGIRKELKEFTPAFMSSFPMVQSWVTKDNDLKLHYSMNTGGHDLDGNEFLNISFAINPSKTGLLAQGEFEKVFKNLPDIIQKAENRDQSLLDEVKRYETHSSLWHLVNIPLAASVHTNSPIKLNLGLGYIPEENIFLFNVQKSKNDSIVKAIASGLEDFLTGENSFNKSTIKTHVAVDTKMANKKYSSIKLSIEAAEALAKDTDRLKAVLVKSLGNINGMDKGLKK